MSWPGVIPAGTSCRQPAITLDITATLARVGRASVTPEAPLDGIDLLPVVTGTRPPDLNRTLFWRRRTIQQGGKIDTVRARAIRRGPWKYHEDCVRNRTFLVNLDQDPREEHNLLEARPELAAELKAALTAWEHEVTPHSEQRREP
jgi:arylsulfatase A-like enzyme